MRGQWTILAAALLLAAGCDESTTGPEAPTVARVDVTPATLTLQVGDTLRVSAVAKGTDGSVMRGVQVAWASLDEMQASVQGQGATALVTALRAGPATVSATVQGKVGTATLSVTPRPPVASRLEITSGGGFLEVGEESHLRAVVRGDDGSIMDGTGLVWSSDHEDVVTVAPLAEPAAARVRAQGPGAARITVRLGALSASVQVTVGPVSQPTSSVGINPATLTVELGKAVTLRALAWAKDGSWIDNPVTHWRTEDASIATVDAEATPGRVTLTARAPGTVTIHAISGGNAASARITVVPAPQVAYVLMGTSEQRLWKGSLFRFDVQVLGPGGVMPDAPIVWSVDDPTVADVDASGLIQARKAGTTRVVAESGGVQGVATIRVRDWPADGSFTLTLQVGVDPTGMPRLLSRVGTTLWTDSLGVEHEASLWLRAGSISFDGNGRYTRRIVLDVRISGFGGILQVVDQRTEEISGWVGLHLLDPFTFFLHPDGGDPFVELRPWQGQAGQWVTSQKFGELPVLAWLWTME